jgi:hypothetical protein
MWQRCGTDRPNLDPGTALQPLQRIGATMPVQLADELRVGVAVLVRGELVAEPEVHVEVPAAEVAQRVPIEVHDRPRIETSDFAEVDPRPLQSAALLDPRADVARERDHRPRQRPVYVERQVAEPVQLFDRQRVVVAATGRPGDVQARERVDLSGRGLERSQGLPVTDWAAIGAAEAPNGRSSLESEWRAGVGLT